ncbi:hypothetical protein FHS37_003273 [Streptomyces griseostramineus]|uniref:Uncharacterized protein n=1 Tax=Streptomyces griseomycini TaxID=66895 RepID=A0A7W7LZ74_9ACTN|nr:hypothetical protein [Streptomyces griseomycini]
MRTPPLHDTAQNPIRLEILPPALGTLAWLPVLALTGEARRPPDARAGPSV